MDNDGNQAPIDGLNPAGDAPDGGEEQVDQYFDDGGEVFLAADHVSNTYPLSDLPLATYCARARFE